MNSRYTKIAIFAILAVLLITLAACGIKQPKQTLQPATTQPQAQLLKIQPELTKTVEEITTKTLDAKEDIDRLEELSKQKGDPKLEELTQKIKTLYSQNTITELLDEISKKLESDSKALGEASVRLSIELLLMDQLIDQLVERAQETNDAQLLDIANDLEIQFDKIRDKFLEEFLSRLEEETELDLNDLDNDGVPSEDDPDETNEDEIKEELETKFETEIDLEQRLRIRAETNNLTTAVKIELRFNSNLLTKDEILNKTIEELTLTQEEIDALLKLQQEDEDEDEEEQTRFKVKVKRGVSEIKFELRFNTNQTNRTQIIQEILNRLPPAQVLLNSVLEFEDKDTGEKIKREKKEEDEEEEEIEIEAKIRLDKGFTKVKIKIEDKTRKIKDEFNLETTNESEIILEISKRTNLTQGQVRSIIDLETKGGDDEDEEDDNDDNEDEEDEEELEIEAEIYPEDGFTKVEVEINNKEDKFTLTTIIESEIISQIAQKYNLTQEEVSKIIEFETEEDDD